jgi:hypothetical protein
MSINTATFGAGNMTVSVADGSFTATTGGASGVGASSSQAYDESLTRYVFDQFGNGAATGNVVTPLTSGAADDYITTVGRNTDGVEVINTGAGNDTVLIQPSNVTKLSLATLNASFNGGSGVDILQLFGTAMTLDLTNVNVVNNVKNFESIDITNTANNTLRLNLNSVLNMSDIADNLATLIDEGNMLVLNGNAGDIVQLVGGATWTTVASNLSGDSLNAMYGSSYAFVAADMYRQLSLNGATLFIDQSMTLNNVL